MLRPFDFDNHSPDSAERMHPSPALQATLATVLRKHYPDVLESGSPIQVIGGANINSGNYQVGPYYFKTLSPRRNPEELALLPRISASLDSIGLPCPSFVRNTEGEMITLVKADGLPEGSIFTYVQEFVSGNFFTGHAASFRHFLASIKSMERELPGIDSLPSQAPVYEGWRPEQTLASVEARMSEQSRVATTPFDEFVRTNWAGYQNSCGIAQSYSPSFDSSKLHHIDLHPHNVLVDDQGRLNAILDLESYRPFPRLSQTAFALFKLGRKSIVKGHMTANEFLRLVAEQWDPVVLHAHAQTEVFRRIIAILAGHYLQQDFRWDIDLYKHTFGLVEAQEMFLGS